MLVDPCPVAWSVSKLAQALVQAVLLMGIYLPPPKLLSDMYSGTAILCPLLGYFNLPLHSSGWLDGYQVDSGRIAFVPQEQMGWEGPRNTFYID